VTIAVFAASVAVLAHQCAGTNLIRVRLAPTGEFMPRRSWAVTLDDPEWPVVPFEVRETDVAVEIATEQMCSVSSAKSVALPASTFQLVVCLLKIQIWVWAGAWGLRLEADRS